MNKLIEDWRMMQFTVAQYINSETPGLPMHLLSAGKPIR
jgi:hypothetical protein